MVVRRRSKWWNDMKWMLNRHDFDISDSAHEALFLPLPLSFLQPAPINVVRLFFLSCENWRRDQKFSLYYFLVGRKPLPAACYRPIPTTCRSQEQAFIHCVTAFSSLKFSTHQNLHLYMRAHTHTCIDIKASCYLVCVYNYVCGI